jgi:hypothetical protein
MGPFSPRGASCTCASSGLASVCVQETASCVAVASRSAVQLPLADDVPGGTTWAAFSSKATVSTVRGRIWPRMIPLGRPAVWMLT